MLVHRLGCARGHAPYHALLLLSHGDCMEAASGSACALLLVLPAHRGHIPVLYADKDPKR